jgi:hypothetical protein
MNQWVSCDALDTGTALVLTDAGIFHRDKADEEVRDVICVGDPRNFAPYLAFSKTALFRHYHSVVFASNPDLFNPRMGTALLAIGLVRLSTQLLLVRTNVFVPFFLFLFFYCSLAKLTMGLWNRF